MTGTAVLPAEPRRKHLEQWLQQIFEVMPGGMLFVTAVFVIAYLEALVGVGLVMPGSVLTVFSGLLAYQGKAGIISIMAAAALGALVGDLCSYWIGGRFGEIFWQRKFFRKRLDLLRKTELFFLEHGGKSVFIGRFLGPVRGLVPFIAGISRMPPASFLGYALVSGLLWGISYPGLGYLGGTGWTRAETQTERLALIVVLALTVFLLVHWLRRHFLGPKTPRSNG